MVNMEYIECVTGPSVLPVSVDDCKAWMRLNDSTEDDLISEWIEAAAFMFMSQTGYALTETALRLNLDGWPVEGVVYLPRRPLKTITSVEYLDTAGSWQTLTGTSADLKSVPGRVVLGPSRPSLHNTQVPKLRVNFTAGHATADAVPKAARVAVKQLVGHYYNQREAYGEISLNEVPMGWKAVCSQFATGIQGSWNGGN